MSADGAPDVVSAGSERAPRRGRRLLVVVLVLLVVAAVAGDRLQRRREDDALVARARDGQEAVRYADGRVRSALTYASPALGRPDTSDPVRADLGRLVSDAAGGRLADVRAQQASVAALRVLPWHREQRAARAAYGRYLSVRLGYLTAVAGDVDVLHGPHPELADALALARQAYAAALGERGRAALER